MTKTWALAFSLAAGLATSAAGAARADTLEDIQKRGVLRCGLSDRAPGFSLEAGFAANGYGEHSPGKYELGSALITEFVMTFFFLLVILGATSERAPKGFAPIAIGLGLTLIHLISIPVTNTSVNPARSTGPALFAGGWAIAQLWLFWVAPLAGAACAGLLHNWLGAEDSAADRVRAVREAGERMGEALAPSTAREPR